jgi:hypothetical protein
MTTQQWRARSESALRWLRARFSDRWPAGEPVLGEDGKRIGTRLPDGGVILAPGYRFEALAGREHP